MQQQQASLQHYGHIQGEQFDSALVTSQYQIENLSPKMNVEYCQSERKGEAITPQMHAKIKTQLTTQQTYTRPQFILNAHQLPQVTLIFPKSRQISACFEMLEKEALKHSFHCIQKSTNNLILFSQLQQKISKQLSKIFCNDSHAATNSRNCVMIVKYEIALEHLTFKSLSGVISTQIVYIYQPFHKNEELLDALVSLVKQNSILKQEPDGSTRRNDLFIHDIELDIYQNPYYLDSIALTMVYKYVKQPLVQKHITSKLNNVQMTLNALQKPTLKQLSQQITSVSNIATSVYDLIIQTNDSVMNKPQNQILHPYYKLAIEKYLYEHIHSIIFPFYVQFFSIKEEQFQQKKKKIRAQIQGKMNPLQTMKFLDIKEKFTTITKEQQEFYSNQIASDLKLPPQPPYMRAIKEMEKISLMSTPREKLKCIQQMLCMVKAEALEFNKTKEELVTMDDELPIIIYIILMSQFENQYAEINYVDDFANTDENIENEQRILTNMKVLYFFLFDNRGIIGLHFEGMGKSMNKEFYFYFK